MNRICQYCDSAIPENENCPKCGGPKGKNKKTKDMVGNKKNATTIFSVSFYCSECGEQLKPVYCGQEKYETSTGRRISKAKFICPSRDGYFAFWKHTTLKGIYPCMGEFFDPLEVYMDSGECINDVLDKMIELENRRGKK